MQPGHERFFATEIEPYIDGEHLAFPHGAAVEIIEHGKNGFLVQDEDEMAAMVDKAALETGGTGLGWSRGNPAHTEAASR